MLILKMQIVWGAQTINNVVLEVGDAQSSAVVFTTLLNMSCENNEHKTVQRL